MKRFLFALSLLCSFSAFAAEDLFKQPVIGGGLAAWNYHYSYTSTYFPSSNVDTNTTMTFTGLSGGWVWIRERGIGIDADGTFWHRISPNHDWGNGWIFQAQANATLGLSKHFFLFAGLSYLISIDKYAVFSGVGPQAGVGFLLPGTVLKLGYQSVSDIGNSFSILSSNISKRYRGAFLQVLFEI